MLNLLRFVGIVAGVLLLTAWIVNGFLMVKTRNLIFTDPDLVPAVDVVVVPGASVYRSGKLSPVLQQRVEAALVFLQGRDSVKLLLSGHVTNQGYNEPAAMAEYARRRGIPPSRILLDSAGSSTYATIFNARRRPGIRTALVSSQRYHLPRSLYITDELGLDAYGLVAPDIRPFQSGTVPWREIFSRQKDFFLLHFFRLFRSDAGGA